MSKPEPMYNRITNADDNKRPPVFCQTPCCTFVALLSYLSLKFKFVSPATLYLHIFLLIGEIKVKNWS